MSRPAACSFFFSIRRRHTRSLCDWSSDVCSSDLDPRKLQPLCSFLEDGSGPIRVILRDIQCRSATSAGDGQVDELRGLIDDDARRALGNYIDSQLAEVAGPHIKNHNAAVTGLKNEAQGTVQH